MSPDEIALICPWPKQAVTLAYAIQVKNNSKKKHMTKKHEPKIQYVCNFTILYRNLKWARPCLCLKYHWRLTALCYSHGSAVKWNDWLLTPFQQMQWATTANIKSKDDTSKLRQFNVSLNTLATIFITTDFYSMVKSKDICAQERLGMHDIHTMPVLANNSLKSYTWILAGMFGFRVRALALHTESLCFWSEPTDQF